MPIQVTRCANSNCKWPIYKGDQVWKRGNQYFCHLKCLVEVMKEENKKTPLARRWLEHI